MTFSVLIRHLRNFLVLAQDTCPTYNGCHKIQKKKEEKTKQQNSDGEWGQRWGTTMHRKNVKSLESWYSSVQNLMKIMVGFSKIIASYGFRSDELMNRIMITWRLWRDDVEPVACAPLYPLYITWTEYGWSETIKRNEIHLECLTVDRRISSRKISK